MPSQLCMHRPYLRGRSFPNNAYPRRPILAVTFFIAVLLLQCPSSVESDSDAEDAETLLKFKESLSDKDHISDWKRETPPCVDGTANWNGVLCEKDKIIGFNLVDMGLSGSLDLTSLEKLTNLRAISFINNDLSGKFPTLNKLVNLKTMYFSGNKFSGEIDPKAFEGMDELKKIQLSNNQLSGPIPSSLAGLKKLAELQLDGNKFSGEIPDFSGGSLKNLNVSNNQLTGPIPQSLSKLDPSSFSGNEKLCGPPLKTACPDSPPASTKSDSTPDSKPEEKKSSSSEGGTSTGTIVGIVVGLVVLVAVIVLIVFLYKRRQNGSKHTMEEPLVPPPHVEDKDAASSLDNAEKGASPRVGGGTPKSAIKMTFLREDAERFELEDLLKASAEVLGGSGHFGSSYKAGIPSGKMMVAKRYRNMNEIGKEEFQDYMRNKIGRLSHPNLLPLVAFYYRTEEKLLVAEFVDNFNLAVHLRGNSSRGIPSPDWATRLKIIKGVSEGLEYLYTELPSITIPHGHLKSSNVLLTRSLKPLLTDYALVPVVNPEHAKDVMVAYKSPEFKHTGRVTRKTDVWSLGLLILEILTGKLPSNLLQQGKGGETDLASWVLSKMNQGNASELFDKELGDDSAKQGQMMKLLKIGLACAESDVDKRLDIKEAVAQIQQVKEKDSNDGNNSPVKPVVKFQEAVVTIEDGEVKEKGNNNNNNNDDDNNNNMKNKSDLKEAVVKIEEVDKKDTDD